MSNPARSAREAAAANGFTEVKTKHRHGITLRNPTTGKCCFETQVGQIYHFGPTLEEADSAWVTDTDTNYLKMVKCDFNLRARKLFNAGDLIRWTDPASSQYVKFQPQNLQWIGDYNSNSVISTGQAIAAPVVEEEDKLYWANAFGSGRHFRYTASTTSLIKHLILDQGSLPACPTYINNPWLELTFTLTPSAGVTLYIDGVAWDNSTAKTTANRIEFRLPTGEVVWSLAEPRAFDSSGDPDTSECSGSIRIYVKKKIKYCGVRFPKSWVDTAQFPIYLDPTLDYQTAAAGDDGYWYNTTFDNSSTTFRVGHSTTITYKTFARWVVTMPAATIDVANIRFYQSGLSSSASEPKPTLRFEDAANPAAVSGYADGDGKTPTTASVEWRLTSNNGWKTSASLVSILQELADSYSYAAGAAMQMLIEGNSSIGGNYLGTYRTYDYSGNAYGPKLHIEYTEGATSSWAGTWGG